MQNEKLAERSAKLAKNNLFSLLDFQCQEKTKSIFKSNVNALSISIENHLARSTLLDGEYIGEILINIGLIIHLYEMFYSLDYKILFLEVAHIYYQHGLASNLDPVMTAAMAYADHTLLVATGDNTCGNNIRKLRRFIRGKDGDLSTFSLIVNRQSCSGHACCQSPKQLETVLCLPVITVLPEDNHVWMYNNAGISILSGKPQPPLQKALQQLSQIIISTIAADCGRITPNG